jgi:hypothetical protein
LTAQRTNDGRSTPAWHQNGGFLGSKASICPWLTRTRPQFLYTTPNTLLRPSKPSPKVCQQ